MINTNNLNELDCINTASPKLLGRTIRLFSAGLVGLNGIVESLRMNMANHSGLIVYIEGRCCVMEMLQTGLEINPINDYIVKRDKIVSIKRLPVFDDPVKRSEARKFLLSVWSMSQTEYGTEKLFKFLGIDVQKPGHLICSELAEIVANMYNATWDKWQLKRPGKLSRIAPCEIQYGTGRNIDWIT